MNEVTVRFRLNGREVEARVEARLHAVDFLREAFELSSPRVGCEHGVCGACTLRVNGQVVRGCLILGMQLDGTTVETVEGLTATGEIADLQRAFHERNASQCGFCTAGMLLTASSLLAEKPNADRQEVRAYMSGNYCRCTGYQSIVDAVCEVLETRRLRAAQAFESELT